MRGKAEKYDYSSEIKNVINNCIIQQNNFCTVQNCKEFVSKNIGKTDGPGASPEILIT